MSFIYFLFNVISKINYILNLILTVTATVQNTFWARLNSFAGEVTQKMKNLRSHQVYAQAKTFMELT